LIDQLNPGSHDNPGKSSDNTKSVPLLIREVLRAAHELLGDFPWHLNVDFTFGEQPKVLSGEAWSHGSPSPRSLKIIKWDGSSTKSRMLIWNKNGKNPVIPDAEFINRP